MDGPANERRLLADGAAPVCIAGTHRSGASIVTELLYQCGLYLGPEDQLLAPEQDNPDAYWENKRVHAINDRILETYGGRWDLPPPLVVGWEEDKRLRPLRAKAERLLREFEGRGQWGWKDPCNSLTLPFWLSLLPDSKVVVCVRNPLEVALSLGKCGNYSNAFSLNLWTIYNERLLDNLPENQYIVTHFEGYLYRPNVELRRLLDFLELPASDQLVARARSSTFKALRHHRVTTQQLLDADVSPQLFELYLYLCKLSGWDHAHLPTMGRASETPS